MPIFEYSCESCGNHFEKLVRRTAEADAVRCPSCGTDDLKTEYSTFAARSGKSSGESTAAECGSGMCGSNFCGTGACGMNMN